MSYDDYGDESRRPSRRREPAGPAKVQGSTAAAILVFVAIVGFGIGALIGNSGGEPSTTPTADQPGATPGSPDNDQSTDADGTAGEEGTASGEEGENTTDAPADPAGGNGITVDSQQDGGEVAAGESGTIEVQATLDSQEEGVTLRVERSLDGGQTWEEFCGECTGETSGGGTYSTNFWSSRSGENMFRIVGPDGLASNPIAVNVVEGDDEDSE